jgi:hypothetical protein
MTSFWCGEGFGRRDYSGAIGRLAAPRRGGSKPAGVKISESRLASWHHLVSVPLRRTASAWLSEPFQGFDLDAQFGDRAGGGGLVEDFFLGGSDFVVGCFVQVCNVFAIEGRQ